MGFFPPFQTLAAGLGTRSLLLRLGFIGAVLGGLALLFAWAAGWLPPRPVTRSTVVGAFEAADGRHEGFRRNHAKGLDFTGYFESTGDGAALSRASLFAAGRVPVVGRFSLAGGRPFAADADRAVRGLAVLFRLKDGQEWRTATINLPVFPVRDGRAFYERLVASAPDPATGKPDPAKMKAFLAAHPESARAGALLGASVPSSGFENTRFNALNAFR
ncbi:MAG TPA: catalase, partial [Candidatus Methylacidiphilales bacterium]